MKVSKTGSEAVEKAMVASHTQSKSVIDNNYRKNKYLKTEVRDSKNNLIENYKAKVKFDYEKLDEDEILDGYYIIETNLIGRNEFIGKITTNKYSFWDKDTMQLVLNRDLYSQDIIEIYRGLWRIEDCFRLTKSTLNIRPTYVQKEKRINSHVLICFIALTILKLLQKLSNYQFTINEIIESLRNAKVAEMNYFYYLNLFNSPYLTSLRDTMGLNYGINVFKRSELNKMEKITTKDN